MSSKRVLKTSKSLRLLSLGVAVLLMAACLTAYFMLRDNAAATVAPPGGDGSEQTNGGADAGGGNLGAGFDLSKPFAPRWARNKAGANGVAWEINFGGGGEDEIGQVLEIDGDFYIFGATKSTDGDFKGRDSGSLFAAILSAAGQLKAVSVFGDQRGSTFKTARYNPYNDDFYVLGGFPLTAGFCVYELNARLETVKSFAYMSGTQDAPEDLIVSSSAINVFYSRTNQYTNTVNIGMAGLPHDLSRTLTDAVTGVGSFRFVRAFPRGGSFAVLINCNTAGERYPAIVTFDKATTPVLSALKQTASADLYAADMTPAGADYLIFLCDRGQGYAASVLRASPGSGGKFVYAREFLLNAAPCTDGRFFYRNETSRYAVSYKAGLPQASLIADGSNGLIEVKFSALTGAGTVVDHTVRESGAAATAVFLSDNHETALSANPNILVTALTASNERVSQRAFGGNGEDRAVRIFEGDGGHIVFANTRSKGGDIGDNFGGTDAWVLRITP
ncbi:hypothetical protein FACS1894211_11820 [Clostridia bacterium]|nr:hypothetical protein FACS1894211_11820 [Clostridia bacterium]